MVLHSKQWNQQNWNNYKWFFIIVIDVTNFLFINGSPFKAMKSTKLKQLQVIFYNSDWHNKLSFYKRFSIQSNEINKTETITSDFL